MSQAPFNMQQYLTSISEEARKEAQKKRLKVLKKTWNQRKDYSDGTIVCKAVDDGKQCNKEFRTKQGLYNHQQVHLWIAKEMDPKGVSISLSLLSQTCDIYDLRFCKIKYLG